MAEELVKCTQDHPKYQELRTHILDLVLKGDGCTPKILRNLYPSLTGIFQRSSFNNQVSRTKASCIKNCEENNINLGNSQAKQPAGSPPEKTPERGGMYRMSETETFYNVFELSNFSRLERYYSPIILKQANQSSVTLKKTTTTTTTKKKSPLTTTKKKSSTSLLGISIFTTTICSPPKRKNLTRQVVIVVHGPMRGHS